MSRIAEEEFNTLKEKLDLAKENFPDNPTSEDFDAFFTIDREFWSHFYGPVYQKSLEDLIDRVINEHNLATTLTNNYLANKESETSEQKELRYKAVKDFINSKNSLSQDELYKDKSGSVLGIEYVDNDYDDYELEEDSYIEPENYEETYDNSYYKEDSSIYGCDGMMMPNIR